MISAKGTIIVAVIGYGLYHFGFGHDANFTVIPPTKGVVTQAMKNANPTRINQYTLTVQNKCTRVGGGMVTDGIFACEVEFVSKSGGEQPFMEKVMLVKRKGQWVVR